MSFFINVVVLVQEAGSNIHHTRYRLYSTKNYHMWSRCNLAQYQVPGTNVVIAYCLMVLLSNNINTCTNVWFYDVQAPGNMSWKHIAW